ncbi:hypothetical protein GOODEAATRI_002231, partial [Goodea atripinnis]
NTMKLKVADAAVDSMKQQMLELCRSDTLSRARQQHDRDLAIIKEQHEAAFLALQQKLDSTSQAMNDQVSVFLLILTVMYSSTSCAKRIVLKSDGTL